RCEWVRLLLAGVLVCFVAGSVVRAEDPPEKENLKKATADGKYTKLLAVIHVPKDKAGYGQFKDYGPFDGTEWAGYEGPPKGNWVYVYPHWYTWEKEGKGGDKLPLAKASVDGKYSKLLAVIRVPDDKETYSEFKDYGPFDGTEWAGYKRL